MHINTHMYSGTVGENPEQYSKINGLVITHGPQRWNHGSTDGLFLLLLLLLLLLHITNLGIFLFFFFLFFLLCAMGRGGSAPQVLKLGNLKVNP